MDIQKMKEDIKDMNETVDKNSKNNINMDNNTITIMNNKKIGNKQTLKPIIKKKDNIVNNKGNMLSINNKNIIENNKNPSQRYQGILYKLKKQNIKNFIFLKIYPKKNKPSFYHTHYKYN